MGSEDKTKEELINELAEMRRKIALLEAREVWRRQVENKLWESNKKLENITGVKQAGNEPEKYRQCERVEEKLRESEEFTRAVLNALMAHIAVLDRNGNIIAVNDAWKRFGRENGSVDFPRMDVGVNYLEVCRLASGEHTNEARQALEGIKSVLDCSKSQFILEYPCHSPGEERWFLMRVTPHPGEGGVVVSHIDITQRRQAEEALKSRNRMLSLLSQSAARQLEFPFTTIDYQMIAEQLLNLSGAMLTSIQSYDDVTGQTTTRALAGPGNTLVKIINFLGFNPLGKSWQADAQSLEKLQTGRLTRADGLYELTFRRIPQLLCRGLEKLLKLGDIFGIGLVHQGRLLGNLVVLMPSAEELRETDIIEIFARLVAASFVRSRVEEALRNSRELYRSLIEHLRDAVFVTTPQLRLIEANPAACGMLGYEREEFMDLCVEDVLYSDSFNGNKELLSKMLEQGFVFGEIKLRKKYGGYIYGEVNAVILPDGNYLGTVRDITERRRLEQEMARLERLNLVGEMAAGIGHEIRNPMTTVRGFLQMLSNKNSCMEYSDFFNLMIEELDRANSIITEFLSLAKNKKIELKVQDLNHIVNAISPLIIADAMAGDKYVAVEQGEIPDLLLNEKEIRQLLLNLVRNGLEAMKPGGELFIKTYMDDEEVVLSVQDQGEGMEPQVLEKIGTPFFTTKEHGTGLGLAVCFSIATRHNASINVQSSSQGTTFWVRFNPASPCATG